MSEVPEISSVPITLRPATVAPVPPQTQYNSPSLSRAPFLAGSGKEEVAHEEADPVEVAALSNTLNKAQTPRFITPLGSPIRKALKLTKLNPHDAWLPITESRNGNAYYAAFHTLCSGIGVQALILPVAFTILGW